MTAFPLVIFSFEHLNIQFKKCFIHKTSFSTYIISYLFILIPLLSPPYYRVYSLLESTVSASCNIIDNISLFLCKKLKWVANNSPIYETLKFVHNNKKSVGSSKEKFPQHQREVMRMNLWPVLRLYLVRRFQFSG